MYKKKILISLLCVAVLTIGTQVYAETVLNTNIAGLIRDGVASIKAYYLKQSGDSMSTMDVKYKTDIDNYVIAKGNDIDTAIDQHTKAEMNRADNEINAYIQALKQQVDSTADQQIKDAKSEITAAIDQAISDEKSSIDKEFEKLIKEKINK